MLGCGLFGLVVVWLLPAFWLSFMFLLLLFLGATITYISMRNEKVPTDEKVLTMAHLQDLAHRWFKTGKAKKTKEAKEIPIRFLGKSSRENKGDPTRVARAAASKGYKAALDMVYEAIQQRATDIHMEPGRDEMQVRYRIDGILHATTPFERGFGDGVVNIFKVLANLDITEKRKPQDGSFAAIVDEQRTVDFRVATAGSVAGEKMVMRILDRDGGILTLDQIGMRDAMQQKLRRLVTQPHGLFIVCGPTGAGKSTTLYGCLSEIDCFQMNVITVENPVEYQIDNVTQIEVNPKAGKTFAGELRSILRQDPDVIYIGEIRDQETAEIACQAAQTGHMVFTTLHANDTSTAVARLIDLGVAPFLISSALTAVLGQRLVRVLCPECKVKYRPNQDLLRKANLPAGQIKYFYRPKEEVGENEEVCENCLGTGYRGRSGVFELLEITDKIREQIKENPNITAIKQEAVRAGMKTLQEDGLRQVIEGTTSIQELLRVAK